ncbi:SH3 domain-containing protein [Roseibium suaedae]|uniref:SH3 domain-containing protein n=1 Tax=Roseibium suaedae TaxID=735517 RepID=A0A1M7CL15_9HYPH|nr:SH3 domain-containing protein [Roseibium suaedae]SHL67509.1 SH3 domain-containing protein [Roseibium suaedae]
MHQTLDASKPMTPRRPSGSVAWGPQSPSNSGFPRRVFNSTAAAGNAPKRPRILWTEDGSDLDLPDLLAAGPAFGEPFSGAPAGEVSPHSPALEEAANLDAMVDVHTSAAAASKASTPAKGFGPLPRPAFSLPVWPVSFTPKRVAGIVAGVSLAALTGLLLLPPSEPGTGDKMVTTAAISVQPDEMTAAQSIQKDRVTGSRFAQSFSEAEREQDGALAQKIQDRVPAVVANSAKDPMASLVSQTAEAGDTVRMASAAGLPGEEVSSSLAQSPEAHGASTALPQDAVSVDPASDSAIPEAEAAVGLTPQATSLSLGDNPAAGTANASVNMREGADMGTDVIGVVPAGAKLSVGACNSWWCAVSHDGKTGYIGRKYIDTTVAQAG